MRLLLVALLLSAVPASSQDLSAFARREYTSSDGSKLLYRILLPENYERTKKYPLVLFLHGAGERGSDNEKQLIHGAKQFLEPLKKQFGEVEVIPTGDLDLSSPTLRVRKAKE